MKWSQKYTFVCIYGITKETGRKCVFRIGHVFVHVSWAEEGVGGRRQYKELNEKMNMTSKSKKVAEQNILNNGKCNVKHFEPWGGGQRWWWM